MYLISSRGVTTTIVTLIVGIASFLPGMGQAVTYPLPGPEENIIGKLQTTTVLEGESLGDIGRRFDMGVYEMIEANPHIDPWAPAPGAEIVIPSQFVLPPGERKGIVLNLAEMRLYYFHPNHPYVSTFPVGVGKLGWHTPLVETKVISKEKNPNWYPPKSIKEEHAQKGDPLPDVVPPGPDNPLGNRKMVLAYPSLLIHGSNLAGGVGLRTSHGCIRLFQNDIEELFDMVTINTPVRIIHEPYKIGRLEDRLYFEAHEPLSERRLPPAKKTEQLQALFSKNAVVKSYEISWPQIEKAAQESLGYPVLLQQNSTDDLSLK